MIEDDDMREIFFDTDDFGEEIRVALNEGEPFTLVGIFDAKPVNTASFQNRFPEHGGARPSGSNPRFRCRSSDIPKDAQGAAVTIRERDYTIFKVEHDGTGTAFVEVKLA